MTSKEIKGYLRQMQVVQKKIASSKEEARKHLIRAGIITESGELVKGLQKLCTPQN